MKMKFITNRRYREQMIKQGVTVECYFSCNLSWDPLSKCLVRTIDEEDFIRCCQHVAKMVELGLSGQSVPVDAAELMTEEAMKAEFKTHADKRARFNPDLLRLEGASIKWEDLPTDVKQTGMGITTLGHARAKLRQQQEEGEESLPSTARPSALKKTSKTSDQDETRSVASAASSVKRLTQAEQAPTTRLAQKKKAKIAEKKARAAASDGGTVTGAAAHQSASSSGSRAPDRPVYNISSRASAAGSIASERGSVSTLASDWAMVEEDTAKKPDEQSSATSSGTRPKAPPPPKAMPTAKAIAKAATGISVIKHFKPTGAIDPMDAEIETGNSIELLHSTAAWNMVLFSFAIAILIAICLLRYDKNVTENPRFIKMYETIGALWVRTKQWITFLRKTIIKIALKFEDEEMILVSKKKFNEELIVLRDGADARVKEMQCRLDTHDLIMKESIRAEQQRNAKLRNAAINVYRKSHCYYCDPGRIADEDWETIFEETSLTDAPPKHSAIAEASKRMSIKEKITASAKSKINDKGSKRWCTAYNRQNDRDAAPEGCVIVNEEFDDGNSKMPTLSMHLKDGHFIILGSPEHGKRAHRDYQCPTVQSWVRGQFHRPDAPWDTIARQMTCMVPCKDCFPTAATHDIYRFKESHLKRTFEVMTQANVSFARHAWRLNSKPFTKEYLEKYAVIYDESLAQWSTNRHSSPRAASALLRNYRHFKEPSIIMPKENFLMNVRRIMSYTKVVRATGAKRPRVFFFPVIKYQSFHVTDERVGFKAKVEYPLNDRMNDEIWLGYNRVHKCEALWERIRPLGYVFYGGAHREIPYDKDGNVDLVGYWPTPICGSFPAPLPANTALPYALNDSDDDDDKSSMGGFSLAADPQPFFRPDFPRAAIDEDVELEVCWYDAFGNKHTGTGIDPHCE